MGKPIAERAKWQDHHQYFCSISPDPSCLICFPPDESLGLTGQDEPAHDSREYPDHG